MFNILPSFHVESENWERSGMSENAFYLMNKSSKPKNPVHKLSQDEKQTIINRASNSLNKAIFLSY